jgi:hypothetical protein
MIEAVVLYSSNDNRFAKICIQSLVDARIKTHVITYSHMWNGTLEDIEVLDNSLSSFNDNPLFCRYIVDWVEGQSPWYWEGLGRYLGTQEVSNSSEYILYIDIDEIIDSEKFKIWYQDQNFKQYDALKLSTYWYWREPIYQAHQLEDSIVILKTPLAKQLSFTPGGREIYFNSTLNRIEQVNKIDPMIHHYSWVRTKEEMLNKVSNWGHSSDRGNWIELVEEEFSRPFNGKDFLHGYDYKIVENKFNIKINS